VAPGPGCFHLALTIGVSMPAVRKRPEITLRVAAGMLWRAMLLRCPHCGGKGVMESWFKLKERCPRCGLHLNREEGDYFLGAYMIMLIVMEMFFALGFLIVLLVTWPDPPWNAIQWVGAIVLFAGILVAYPFAKTLWLAFDLMFRPVGSAELRWNAGDPAIDRTTHREDDARR
ncbi:MAG TPA: DUF983 domain-containing protein, partial [Gemmatimonadaceae bacterium]|nr:DUF983 domain-containing protein [Gemmatimonadaceae bacterium]